MHMKDRSRSSGSLVSRVGESLRQAILSGQYSAGDKLPSEHELTETHSVSRTVVREAVAALRSDGLVEVRQGAGIFVIGPDPTLSGRKVDKTRVASDLEVLEIRTPVEIEAAGLAALRRSPAQEEAIFECHRKILQCIETDQSIREADLELHVAIAEATNNPLFKHFLQSQGSAIIPQSRLVPETRTAEQTAYRKLIHREHEVIIVAISDRDDQAARNAMREHLVGSQTRYRNLLKDLRSFAT
ncbi:MULTISPECIES: FadR/GntR family transcriptional regulator [unclassified Rhizobium]|uniref:FadR/GntR family transcriptional regulator n=1 Tax=unclassified Rhizobium TaxID=2613769 RepID=UPI001C83D152|nr:MULTISPECIES: FadR/GntR family transcriptional regulator [unclassified Rhizobium]MBX5166271.1 FadR family transcriptional regulator [Rhizobium sp. NZLR4b]MBX5168620.1 FadR family transcriptional regulator [Rhizobium sp. NZLR1b]MBX5210142.1 FadR family transcriptional regulator [Rhizobium sp. NZLR11]